MITQQHFGTTKDGQEVTQFTLKNKNGIEVRCIDYGCRLTHLFVPSPAGEVADILLGYDTLAEYETDGAFHGAFVGRYANRIKGAAFELDGEKYNLIKTEGNNYLHGCFHSTVFKAEIIGDTCITFTHVSPDGAEGFPGELWVGVTYMLTEDNEFIMDTHATTQANTHVNFTNHSYFNLAGNGESIENQNLWLNSGAYLEIDEESIPTGTILQTEGGPFDFNNEKPIGQDIASDDPQLKTGNGYDHCYILAPREPRKFTHAVCMSDPKSGRKMHVYTTQPAIQLYSGNYLGGDMGKNGIPNNFRSGVCFETQHYPDSPNHPEFPSTLLAVKDKYHHITILKF